MKSIPILAALIFSLLFTPILALAQTSLESRGTLEFEHSPVAMRSTSDGSRIFILTDDGTLHIYQGNGSLEASVKVPAGVDDIEILGEGALLGLLSGKDRNIQLVEVVSTQSFTSHGPAVRGPDNAPVTIAVFDDFQCPYCARLAPVLDELLERYPDTVRLVFKNFPLRNHTEARPAALAALAAGEQGKFWPYHDLVFANFKTLKDQSYISFATELGLDMERFDSDRRSEKLQNMINADIEEGNQAGVRGTPSIFINGKRFQNRGLDSFRAAIEKILAKGKAAE